MARALTISTPNSGFSTCLGLENLFRESSGYKNVRQPYANKQLTIRKSRDRARRRAEQCNQNMARCVNTGRLGGVRKCRRKTSNGGRGLRENTGRRASTRTEKLARSYTAVVGC